MPDSPTLSSRAPLLTAPSTVPRGLPLPNSNFRAWQCIHKELNRVVPTSSADSVAAKSSSPTNKNKKKRTRETPKTNLALKDDQKKTKKRTVQEVLAPERTARFEPVTDSLATMTMTTSASLATPKATKTPSTGVRLTYKGGGESANMPTKKSPLQKKTNAKVGDTMPPKKAAIWNAEGYYERPMGRPPTGFEWDSVRGLWKRTTVLPKTETAPAPAVAGTVLTTKEKKPTRKTRSKSAPPRPLTNMDPNDGLAILPPLSLATDRSRVLPRARSKPGFAWDKNRGVWVAITPTINKNDPPLEPDATEMVPQDRVCASTLPRRYVPCGKCPSCQLQWNCEECLHCKLILDHTGDVASRPVCVRRICVKPRKNPQFQYKTQPQRTARPLPPVPSWLSPSPKHSKTSRVHGRSLEAEKRLAKSEMRQSPPGKHAPATVSKADPDGVYRGVF